MENVNTTFFLSSTAIKKCEKKLLTVPLDGVCAHVLRTRDQEELTECIGIYRNQHSVATLK